MKTATHGAATLVAALLLVLSLAACGTDPGSSPSRGTSPARQPLVVDLDMDSSDVFTLAYVLNLPDHEVRAVTVSGTGVGTCPAGAANAAAIAAVMGHAEVPVACGSSEPMGSGHAFPDGWRAPSDALYGISLPAATPSALPAAELMAQVLSESSVAVDVLVVGPMTNLAQVLVEQPALASKVARVVAMAGALEVEGNVGANLYPGSPEWNVWADPAAAAAVLESGVPLVLVPLDATNQVPIDAEWFTALEYGHGTAGASLTYELLARNPFLVMGGQFWWDPLAATYLERPGVLQLEERAIRIRATAGREFGRTMLDPSGSVVSVAMGADPLAFQEAFSAGLGRGGQRDDGWDVAGHVTVTYDGEACEIGGDALKAGSFAVRVENTTQVPLLVAAATLHPGASWNQLQAFADAIEEQAGNPDFVDLAVIAPPPGLSQVIDLPVGSGGFACVEQNDQGAPIRVVLSGEYAFGA
jgi:pyrimidine-specific ribonucleoside hydrolase